MTTRRPKVPRAARRGTGSAAEPAAGTPGGSGSGDRTNVTPLRGAPAQDGTRGARTGAGTGPRAGTQTGPAQPGASGARRALPGFARGRGASGPVPGRSFSGRMLALAVILVAVTVLLSPTVRIFLQQRGELDALRAEIAEQQQTQTQLQTQIARWDDPAYIKAQARDRINLVMPGEKKYMVIGELDGTPSPAGESPGDVRTDLPWVDALWDSVQRSATD